MQYYHLTVLKTLAGGHTVYKTLFIESPSIAKFLKKEKEVCQDIVVLYSREITKEEYDSYHDVVPVDFKPFSYK